MNDEQPTSSDAVSMNDNGHRLIIQPRNGPDEVPEEAPMGRRSNESIVALVASVLIVGVVVGASLIRAERIEPIENVALIVPPLVEQPKEPRGPDPFETVAVSARAAIVYDVYQERVLFGKNALEPMPLASLTKLMTSLIATERAGADARLAISPRSIEAEGDSGLYANESWKLSDLLSFTMITSSNDGADALATAVGSLFETTPQTTTTDPPVSSFVEAMNERADELGLTSLHFNNATGLDEPSGGSGGTGSAADVAVLLSRIWEDYPAILAPTTHADRTFVSEDGFVHTAINTNSDVGQIAGLLGSKTGYTHLAGGNLAILYDAGFGHPIAVVVLGSSIDGRFADVQTLVDATYEYVESGWYEHSMVAGSTEREL